MTRPKFKHTRLQKKLQKLLEDRAGGYGIVSIEVPFRPVPEFELLVADVSCVERARWEQADPEDNLRGAPDLVIEILSPPNTAAEINETEKVCLENGAREFWVVDQDLLLVKVATPDGITTSYRPGQEIPLRVLGAGALKVDDIFA